MVPKNTKKLNKKYVDFQKKFNAGWQIGLITIISVVVVAIFLIYLFFNALNGGFPK